MCVLHITYALNIMNLLHVFCCQSLKGIREAPLKKPSVARSLLLSCILALLVPFIAGNIAYLYTTRRVSQMTLENNRAVLLQAQNSINERLASMDSILQTLSNNEYLSYFSLNRPADGETYYRVWKFQKYLSQSIATELSVRDIYVFFYNNNLVATNRTSYTKDAFYDRFFRFGQLSYDAFSSLIESTYYEKARFVPSVSITTEMAHYQALAYIKTIPVNIARKYTASVLLLVDEEKLLTHLEAVNTFDSGYTYVLDDTGAVIIARAGSAAQPEYISAFEDDSPAHRMVNGQNMTFVRNVDPANGWQYIAAVPTAQLNAQARRIQTLTMAGSLLSLIIGVLATYVLLKRRVSPLSEAMGKLQSLYPDGGDPVKYPFMYVGEKIDTLLADTERIQYKASSDSQMLTRLCISSVLRGECRAAEQPLAQIGMQGHWYHALVIRTDPAQRPEWYSRFFTEYHPERFYGKVAFIHHEAEVFYALMSHTRATPQESMEQAAASMQALHKKLLHMELDCHIYGGRICSELTEVTLSFYDACDLSRMDAAGIESVMWFRHGGERSAAYVYSVETESKLIEQVRTGRSENVRALLEKVYRDNFETAKLSLDMTRHLFDELQGTLMKVSGDTAYRPLPDVADHEALFWEISKVFLQMCGSFQSKLNQNGDMGTRMLQYIDSSYSDNNLSLKTLAETFGLSESYASKYFKESTGVNFLAYLEGVRIQAAQKMLEAGGYTVNEIAQRVGYLGDKSFRRAYKKRTGDTPKGMYKEGP